MDDLNISLQIWDVTGTALYGKMLDTYVHDANGIVFLYDVTREESFESIKNWVREVALVSVKDGDKDAALKALFGNKNDLNHLAKVSEEDHL